MVAHGERVREEFSSRIDHWPPRKIELLAFKQEKLLEVWADSHHLATYPVLAASGKLGPKFEEGDLQVPEGIYGLPVLNPQSQFHLSIRVDYPNDVDIARARVPRDRMGGDIYVHGKNASIGCLAMGDAAIEEIFTLVALVPKEQRRIVIAPVDFRRTDFPGDYDELRTALASFPTGSP